MAIPPARGAMKPATAFSSDDLPQPEGPSKTKRSPRNTSKLTSCVARTVRCSVRYSRLTWLTLSNGATETGGRTR